MRHDGKKAIHFPFVKNVFLKNVLIKRVSRTAVNEKIVVFMAIGPWQGPEKIPSCVGLRVVKILKLLASPENGLFGPDIEAFRIEKCCLVVISEQTNFCTFHDKVDAFQRIGAVTDRIAQAENFVNAVRINVFQHRFESFQITMDVTDNGTSQL